MIEPEVLCREIYQETRGIYSTAVSQLGAAALGFRILYGPPLLSAPCLFLGFQPGGNAKDAAIGLAEGHHDSWPLRSDYATANWSLARQMRSIWSEELIERCPGLNAIFFRSPSMKAWTQLPREVREKLESFSQERARSIVDALDPQRIIVIGFGTFDRLGGLGGPGSRGDRDRPLTKQGELWGRPATAVLHLSGARISRTDRDRLRGHFRTEASS